MVPYHDWQREWIMSKLRTWFRWYWQFLTVRLQAIIVALGGLLGVWNMLPVQLRLYIPDQVEAAISGIIFACGMLAIWARGRREPKP